MQMLTSPLKNTKTQVDQAARIGVTQVNMGWELKDEFLIAQWAHEMSGHLGRDLKRTNGLVIKGQT